MSRPDQTQRTIIPLSVGMSEAVPREMLGPGKHSYLQNARVRRPGQLEKRFGYSTLNQQALDTGGVIANGKRFIKREDEIAWTNGHFLYSFISSLSRHKREDRVPECRMRRNPVVSDRQKNLDKASVAFASSSKVCVVWEDIINNDVYARIYDTTTGTTIDETRLTTDGQQPEILAIGTTFVAVWNRLSTGSIQMAFFDTLDALAPAWSGVTNLRTDFTAGSDQWDVFGVDTSQFILVYVRSSGELDAYRYNSAGAQQDSALDLRTGQVVTDPGICVNGGVLFVGFQNDTSNEIETLGRSATTLATVSYTVQTLQTGVTVTQALTVGPLSGSACWVAWDVAATATNQEYLEYRSVTAAGAVGAQFHRTFNARLASRVWAYDDHSYVIVSLATSQNEQRSLCAIDLGNDDDAVADYRGRPVARWGEGEIYAQLAGNVLTAVNLGGSGVHYAAFSTQDFSAAGVGRGAGIEVAELYFDDGIEHRWVGQAQMNRLAFVPGALPHVYDGVMKFEAGFVFYPWGQNDAGASNLATPVAGGSLAVGTYDYAVVYCYQDRLGNVWRSAPSNTIVGTTAGANLTLRFRIPHYAVTSMSDVDVSFRYPVTIEVYRRVSGTGNFVRLDPLATVQFDASDPNDPLFLVFTDDGSRQSGPDLYTSGSPGVLENICPPPCNYAVSYDGRIFLASETEIWFSREAVAAEGIFFDDTSSIITVQDGGRTIGLAVTDSAIVNFKRDMLFAMNGNGPDDTGAGINYSTPMRLNVPVGCSEIRSIVVGERGVYFQSARGIERLNRGTFQLEFIGEEVQKQIVTFPNVTSAVYNQPENEIRFSVDNGDGDGAILVYNEHTEVWSVDLLFGENLYAVQDAIFTLGFYFWMHSSGTIAQERPDIYKDTTGISDYWVSFGFVTGDIALGSPFGLQRYHRAILFGRKVDEHALIVGVALSRSDSPDNRLFSLATVDSFLSLPIEICEFRPSSVEAHSIRVLVFDDGAGAEDEDSAGPIWYTLAIEHQPESGTPFPVPVQQRV